MLNRSIENSSNNGSENSTSSKDREQDAGHFEYEIGQILGNRYKIIGHLGDGTFGRTLKC